jgi:TatD DNase family protein
MINYIDIHSHIHDKAFDEDRDRIIVELEKNSIATITIGTDYEESLRALALAKENRYIYASVGMHPVDNRTEEFIKERYLDIAKEERVVAIGECGLDYFRLEEDKGAGFFVSALEEKARQKKLFEAQIELAVEVDKPLMLHGRPQKGSMDAYEDMVEILRQACHLHGDKVRGNFHFFVGDMRVLEKVLALSTFTVSFSGVITFAKEYEEVVRGAPLEMIHVETDSPYASPAKYRGKRNEPLHIREVIAKIAEIKGKDEEEVSALLLKNARRVFLPKTDFS